MDKNTKQFNYQLGDYAKAKFRFDEQVTDMKREIAILNSNINSYLAKGGLETDDIKKFRTKAEKLKNVLVLID